MKQDIISQVARTEKTIENVRKAIPFLVHCAVNQTVCTYKQLNSALGYDRFRPGHVLGVVEDVISELAKVTGTKIPTLNELVVSSNGLPSDGFSYVYKDYDKLNAEGKKIFLRGIYDETYTYQKWNWVLNELGLKPASIITSENAQKLRQSIKSYCFGGGEGAEHKAIKEAIYNNPKLIRYNNVEFKETEHVLYSADRLDVFFVLKNGDHIAVEVKPSTSPEDDIVRGIFQCVKYKAVMDAERTIEASCHNNFALLVIAGSMPAQAKRIANDLNVSYIEKFKA